MGEIVTERLRLRPAGLADIEGLHALASDYEVVRQTETWPWPPDRAFTAKRARPLDPAVGIAGPVFAGDEIVGMMGVHDFGAGAGAEMGYMFAQPHWGKGYATEIGRALIARAFADYDWPAISACVFTDNPASGRVLEKLGFVEGAPCRGACAARGCALDTRTFRLDRGRGVFRRENGPNSTWNSRPS